MSAISLYWESWFSFVLLPWLAFCPFWPFSYPAGCDVMHKPEQFAFPIYLYFNLSFITIKYSLTINLFYELLLFQFFIQENFCPLW